MARQIVLLRGINVGGHRRVSMAALREALTSLGYRDVTTHLQSGNVLLTSDTPPEQLQRDLERQIVEHLSVDPQVLVRTRDELADIIRRDPFGDVAADPKRYQVSFLSGEPSADVVRELAAGDVSPERVVVSGREIYAWHPDGVQRSQLAGLLTDRRLGVTATARNWNTVTKLLELADA
jgi:uncharacterized protein (DUF1697 family)